LELLFNVNWIPVICWHHFEELVRHPEEQVTSQRIAFLKSFPYIAWLPSLKLPSHLGSIVDVFDAEVQALASSPNYEILSLRTVIRQGLFRYTSPSEIETFNLGQEFRPLLEAKAIREQEIASIMHAKEATEGKTKVFQLKNTYTLASQAVQQLLIQQKAGLANDIKNRGDTRISSPQTVANAFTGQVATDLKEIENRGGEPLDAFLQQFDIPKDDVSSTTTLEEIQRIAVRRKYIRASCERHSLDFTETWDKLRTTMIPSDFIQAEIRRARKSAARASGSDLSDDYLVSLAPYVDAVIVDKRTCEYLRQCSRRNKMFRDLVGFYAKTSSYQDLVFTLERVTHSVSGSIQRT
jgi:hypothetical protein